MMNVSLILIIFCKVNSFPFTGSSMVDIWNIFTSMKSLRQGREIITLHLFTIPPVRFPILFS